MGGARAKARWLRDGSLVIRLVPKRYIQISLAGLKSQLAEVWPPNKMIRLLWIDGDHTFKGTHSDFDRFKRFLSPGAIVAFHDVLHAYSGPASVFCEEVLASESFGAWGLCGSIGWAQYCPDKSKQQGVKSKKKLSLSCSV